MIMSENCNLCNADSFELIKSLLRDGKEKFKSYPGIRTVPLVEIDNKVFQSVKCEAKKILTC